MPKVFPRRLGALVLAAVSLAGCAANRVPTPNHASAEYIRSWGLKVIHADAAYRAGATGRGVTVALIDCGLQTAQPEVTANVSPLSTDVAGPRRQPELDRHADYVAGPLGSALNGRGLVGVAYNATLLSVRADFDGGWQGQCAFRPADIARAVDYAVDHQARIIVMPLQATKPLGPAFEAALDRAARAGVVSVVAAGNGAAEQPAWPARYAVDPRFAGSVVVAGATRWDGEMTPWSNRAGPASRWFIAAPGQSVLTDCGRKTCRLVSGTSFAAPYVAGALALVMEGHPRLTGPEAAELLLQAARDAGDPGVDAVYGRGVLDVAPAFSKAAARSASRG